MDEDQERRYYKASHSMQAAIGVLMQREWKGTPSDAKHLRTGINSAMAEHGSLARLLIKKGIIDEHEYFEAVIEGAEMEADLMAQYAIKTLGLPPDTKFI
jgi:hypothetical protein